MGFTFQKNVFLCLKIDFVLANSADTEASESSLFAKVPI